MNICYSMNMHPDAHVIQACLATLDTLPGLTIRTELEPCHEGRRPDAHVTIESDLGISEYIMEARTSVTTTTLGATLAQLERDSAAFGLPPLLAAPYLTPAVTDKLLEAGVAFVDGAGNAFLNDAAAYVLVLGKRPEKRSVGSGFTETDLQLIYAFLVEPRLRTAPYREIHDSTGVSLGQISKTVTALENAHYVYRSHDRTLTFRDLARLLERWEIGYLETLRPKLLVRRGRLGPNNLAKAGEALRGWNGVVLGGEHAAADYTHHLQPATLTIHVAEEDVQAVVAHLRAPRATRDADVFILRHLDHRLDETPARAARLAHPILVRAELLALDDDRLREVANRLLDDVILPGLDDDRG